MEDEEKPIKDYNGVCGAGSTRVLCKADTATPPSHPEGAAAQRASG